MKSINNLEPIIKGYTQGYFLMGDEFKVLSWYSSYQRALIPLDERFRYPKSLQRTLNQQQFSISINKKFLEVCQACAERETTWITPELIQIYYQLHLNGFAHSFETWQGDQLAGGILGITIGSAFIGESMFYRVPNGSKVAMVKLVEHLRSVKFTLFDVQLQNNHLERFGSYVINNNEYRRLLFQALNNTCIFVN
ncbi:leucyl/phenylalanyl-tRNA--protein transferase [Candidatus Atelocyanobacterium thalassae]|uniref:Leucyl/phenylalanyl-tRNA--protein transferase n=2 Tax=Candidatus Atelocyanobacterium thalassae TaxID=713887 RepID=A0A086CIP9_9CHRO|nr:leucyl/phenylalanyl-tRNA--protein transferase [Candidatus Atelocyanobacterium thalassa]KFF42063.1 MAG: leucyl/phenylalanyl-tRNA--protein transferase [Candidatus Atelocyanobacterium thalassa isolate SIO64986]BDA39877.1 leucyl/phenylalanyl-tRNA--protein transferase [cyanobacterium endosymbiont of Braarudosphaera bigelowii]